jgi:hypothetical protein
MRNSLVITASIVILFLGTYAIQLSRDENRPATSTNSTANVTEIADGFFNGILVVAGPAVVYGGIGALVLTALGFLVRASGGK